LFPPAVTGVLSVTLSLPLDTTATACPTLVLDLSEPAVVDAAPACPASGTGTRSLPSPGSATSAAAPGTGDSEREGAAEAAGVAAREVGAVDVLMSPTRSRTSRQSASVKLLKGSRLERTVPEKRTTDSDTRRESQYG
jgi:hypothetical protein